MKGFGWEFIISYS